MRPAILLLCLSLFAVSTLAAGVDLENNSITFSLRTEPPNLDSSLSEDTTSSQILRLINEGLVRIGRRGKILPGVAERWDLDVMQATFHLRPDARWADGKPVTAHDFVYAWQRLVNPETGARGSTLFAYVIANAEEILQGKMSPESLGVKAVDDRTLKVTLSRPVPYLLTVLAGTAFFPLREDFVKAQNGRFAADAANLLGNGPFKINHWTHSASLSVVRDSQYWSASEVQLDKLAAGYITSDVRSLLNLFKSGDIGMLDLNEEILGDAADTGLRIRKSPLNCIAWVTLNQREGRLTSDKRVREAIRLAFDRDSYVNIIVGLPGTVKIDSIFGHGIKGARTLFTREHPAPAIPYDLERARALIAEVRAEKGDTLPPLVLLANETRQVEAEYLQAQLMTGLGLDVRVDKQTFKQAIEKMSQGDFDLTRVGFCGGAVTDPVVYASVFESSAPFNDGAFTSPAYDALMKKTHTTIDQGIRMPAFAEMQQLMFKEIPIIPTHGYSSVYVQDARIKGVQRHPINDFSRGYIQ